MFLSTDFPSVKTLGYFQKTQTLNRYQVALGNALVSEALLRETGRAAVLADVQRQAVQLPRQLHSQVPFRQFETPPEIASQEMHSILQ